MTRLKPLDLPDQRGRATSEMPGPFTRFDVINGVAQHVKHIIAARSGGP